jgi:16S rRNA processing protein RimM
LSDRPQEFLAVGRIARPHGLAGWVRVASYDPASSTLGEVREIFLARAGAPPSACAVLAARAVPGAFLVQLAGVVGRDEAEALRGAELWVRRADLPPLAEDEVYLEALVGCAVVESAGAPLGEVVELLFPGAQPVLVVRDDRHERLIPLAPELLAEVDVGARRIRLAEIEDLPAQPLPAGRSPRRRRPR